MTGFKIRISTGERLLVYCCSCCLKGSFVSGVCGISSWRGAVSVIIFFMSEGFTFKMIFVRFDGFM